MRHRVFRELPQELSGELVVINDTRVVPARLRLERPGGGDAEVLLLEPTAEDLGAIGASVMNERRRGRVMRTATRTVLEQLERPEVQALLPLIERPAPTRPAEAPAGAKPSLRPAI